MESHIPLLCSCDECQATHVAFSHEFNFAQNFGFGNYTKIYGVNRIAPGNWLYFKGTVKPELVKSCFQTAEKEIIVLTKENSEDRKVECPRVSITQEDAPEGYRLLPAQSADALVGDHVYHVVREMFGVVVGIIVDNEGQRLAVEFKDGCLLFVTLPETIQTIPDVKLADNAREKIHRLFPEESRNVSITATQGIIYLDGLVKNYAIKKSLCACINGMPRVRGCVDFMKVRVEKFVSDDQLEKAIYSFLDIPGFKIFDYKVQSKKGNVNVSLSCLRDVSARDLENKIAEYPGVQDLHLIATTYALEEMENVQVCRNLESELAFNNLLAGSIIRVNYVGKKYLLEGKVHSILQKQVALVCVAKRVKTPSIENRLRII